MDKQCDKNGVNDIEVVGVLSLWADVLNISLRFAMTPVPTDETTYICQGFYLPNDTAYHIVGSTPIINNSLVIHHMLLYACRDIPGANIHVVYR